MRRSDPDGEVKSAPARCALWLEGIALLGENPQLFKAYWRKCYGCRAQCFETDAANSTCSGCCGDADHSKSDGSRLRDSSLIIDHYESLRTGSITPQCSVTAFASRLLEVFADEWLPMAALHYRWHSEENMQFALNDLLEADSPGYRSLLDDELCDRWQIRCALTSPFWGKCTLGERRRNHCSLDL